MNAPKPATARFTCAVITILVALTDINCSRLATPAASRPLHEVWTRPDWPPPSMPPPSGFVVTPRQAYEAAAQARQLSLKHAWFCYHDERFYYIADAFGRTGNARNAARYGIRVDGRDGNVRGP